MSNSKTSRRSVIAEERREKALELRKQGLSYKEIGDQIGIAQSAAYRSVRTALARLREDVADHAEDLRTLELERLDKLFTKAYSAAIAGDLAAIDKAVKIMERRARLLGLDEATRTEISGSLLMSSQWLELKAVLIKTLTAYPDAQRAVLAAITAPQEVT